MILSHKWLSKKKKAVFLDSPGCPFVISTSAARRNLRSHALRFLTA